MKFKYEDLKESILCGDSYPEKDLELIEEEDWVADGKYQSRSVIFKHKNNYYIIEEIRSGSPFSEYHYEEQDIDKDGMIECNEVFKNTIVREEWGYIPKRDPVIKELKDKLNEAEDLLSNVRSLLDNVHCYNTEIYRDIGIFLYGEDE